MSAARIEVDESWVEGVKELLTMLNSDDEGRMENHLVEIRYRAHRLFEEAPAAPAPTATPSAPTPLAIGQCWRGRSSSVVRRIVDYERDGFPVGYPWHLVSMAFPNGSGSDWSEEQIRETHDLVETVP